MTDQQILGYSRVSSEEQAAHGISIDAQRGILEGYAAMRETTIRIFEDAGYSGKNTQRPALQALLDKCRDGGVSAVVVWKLDRLSRSLRDTLTIIEDVFQPRNITLVLILAAHALSFLPAFKVHMCGLFPASSSPGGCRSTCRSASRRPQARSEGSREGP